MYHDDKKPWMNKDVLSCVPCCEKCLCDDHECILPPTDAEATEQAQVAEANKVFTSFVLCIACLPHQLGGLIRQANPKPVVAAAITKHVTWFVDKVRDSWWRVA